MDEAKAVPPIEPEQSTSTITFRVWGKLNRDCRGKVVALHPLLDHLVDVAACFDAIARCAGVRRALDRSARRTLTHIDLARLAVLALLHDVGKANAGFQVRFWADDVAPRGWPLACGHGEQGWSLLSPDCPLRGTERLTKCLPLREMSQWGDATASLLRASISHHGRPVAVTMNASGQIWQPVSNGSGVVYDPAEPMAEMSALARRLYPQAFAASDGPPLPDTPGFAHLFAGLVQLADWLGSDTRDGFFPYTEPGEDRVLTAPLRAAHAVRAIGLDAEPWRARIRPQGPTFMQAFGVSTPRPMQAAMRSQDFGPVVVLEAETGSGKTEAALWRFLHLFEAGEVDGLYFALPTRVAATQIYERVRRFIERVWPNVSPVVVRALPGYEAADGETKTSLPGFRVLWSDHPGDADAERRWVAESPKRFLAATIAVGTIDQALLAVLPLKHAHLRHASLARSLLVVDEVHASDAYMTTLLERLLTAHASCGGQALLLSATLGASARSRYLNIGNPGAAPSPDLASAASQPYPSISSTRPGQPRHIAIEGNGRTKTVHWQLLDAIDQPESIAELAISAAAAGARVLIIRNTVPAAVATLRAVEGHALARGGEAWLFRVNGVSTLHHSRFSRQDRPLLDAAVEAQIGKLRASGGGRIVIGTQTLEQSLDIDADLLLTDLCPMDVMLQRVGRLHRHQRPSPEQPDDLRPSGFEQAHAWVLTPSGHSLAPLLKRMQHGLGPLRSRGSGLEGVYLDLRVLEATRRLIAARPARSLPAENRELVEHSIHPEALAALTQELGAEWERFGQKVDGSIGAKASLGRLQALRYDSDYGELVFPEDGGKIATRLGAADRLVTFEPRIGGPFGTQVRELALRHHQLPHDLPLDAQPSEIETLRKEPGFEFTLGTARYRYSRFGLERRKQQDGAE